MKIQAKKRWEALTQFWAFRSFGVGVVATACDVGVIGVGVELLGFSKLNCVTAGAIVGAVVSFTLNRLYSFRSTSHWAPQALRYFGVFAIEVLLHRFLMERLLRFENLPYFLDKFLADAVVFGILHMFAMRLFIFGKPEQAQELDFPTHS